MPVEARNFRQYDRDLGLNGVIAPMGFGLGSATTTLVASRAYACRFVPSRTFSATVIAFAVTTVAGADDACDVGLYDASLNRIVSAGATSGKLNVGGLRTVTIAATTLQAGVTYYAAFSCGAIGGTAGQLSSASSAGVGAVGDFFGTANGTRLFGFQAAGHVLPTSLTLSAAGSVPMLAVKEA